MPRAAVRRSVSDVPRQRTIPFDDEPLTAAQRRAIEAGRAAIARGDYVTLDELKAHVARHRLRSRAKGRR
jgi:predicted transcriptional regulator